MQHGNRWMIVGLMVGALTLGACGGKSSADKASHSTAELATVEHVEGSDVARVTLSASAIKRLDIQTAPIRNGQVNGKQRKVVPYGAVLYDPTGHTWVYTSPKPRTFVRQPITVDYIEGNRAFLSAGPAAGTLVATVGVQELLGTEAGLGGGSGH